MTQPGADGSRGTIRSRAHLSGSYDQLCVGTLVKLQYNPEVTPETPHYESSPSHRTTKSSSGGERRRQKHNAHYRISLDTIELMCLLSILIGSVSVVVLCFRLLPDAVSKASTITRAEWATTRTPEYLFNGELLTKTQTKDSADIVYCRYDGSCPGRMVCDATGNSEAPGVCRPWSVAQHPQSSLATCVDSCLQELSQDEHFYQHHWPAVLDAYSVKNVGTPEGCGIVYKRTNDFALKWRGHDDENKGPDFGPAVEKWINNRFQKILRVDPLSDDLNDRRWVAFCTKPCSTHRDCQTPLEAQRMNGFRIKQPPFYQCIEEVCQKNPDYWEQSDTMDLVLVTAVSAGFFDAFCNLVESVRYWEPEILLVVYYLGGLSKSQIAKIDGWENVLLQWRDGVPAPYPAHVHRLDTFAWRPIIIHDSLLAYKSILFLEAGSTLTGPLDPIQDVLEKDGIFLALSHIDMEQSHPETYRWFGTEKGILHSRTNHFSGRVQGYIYPSRYYDTIVRPNALCALDEKCIAPIPLDMSSPQISNYNETLHHFDRTSLSILAYHEKVQTPHHNEYLAEKESELSPDLTKPSKRVVWGKQNGNFYLHRSQQMEDESDHSLAQGR